MILTDNLLVDTLILLGVVGTAIGGLFATGRLVRLILTYFRKVNDLIDDLIGEPARPGVSRRPGVMERLDNIEKEVKLKNGSSLKDTVINLKADVYDLKEAREDRRTHTGGDGQRRAS